jgi:hypothetical protein
LGLWPEPLPRLPKVLAGYRAGDAVWLWDHRHPASPERRFKARIIAVLPSLHELTLRTEDARIVSLNPILHPAMIAKRSEP